MRLIWMMLMTPAMAIIASSKITARTVLLRIGRQDIADESKGVRLNGDHVLDHRWRDRRVAGEHDHWHERKDGMSSQHNRRSDRCIHRWIDLSKAQSFWPPDPSIQQGFLVDSGCRIRRRNCLFVDPSPDIKTVEGF